MPGNDENVIRHDFGFRDITREPHPEPCPDCHRVYLNGENVTITVPTRPLGTRVVWSGCADCWVKRTNPH